MFNTFKIYWDELVAEYAAKYLNPKTRTEEYQAAQFHFHAKSEHTIDGKRFDLEMHTVYKSNGGFGYS